MPIYTVCKTIVTSLALASVTLLTVSCSHSGGHSAHSSTAHSSTETATANAVAATDGKASEQSMAHDMSHSEAGGAKEEQGEHATHEHNGVNTNHDVFHSKSIEVPAGTPVPAMTVRLEADAVRGWNLYVGTANFTWTPSDVNGESSATEGHAHLYINDKSIQRIYGTWTHLPDLPKGQNDVRVTLNANGHETLTTQGKPIEETVTIDVYKPDPAN
ncbi:MAG: hypothetical protein AAFV90_17865 [Cyanobacteria bacterium J06634_5]